MISMVFKDVFRVRAVTTSRKNIIRFLMKTFITAYMVLYEPLIIVYICNSVIYNVVHGNSYTPNLYHYLPNA